MKPNHQLLAVALTVIAAATPVTALPIISVQPLSQTVNQGYSATFQVGAAGTAPLTYQWMFGADALDGATARQLTIANALSAAAGDYFVVVTDATGSVTSQAAHLAVIPPVPLDPKVGPNIRLGDDPPQLPARQRAQAEPHMARSFADPNLMVATFQEGRFVDGQSLATGYAVSHDGGVTWTRGLVPGLTALTGGAAERASDPVVAIDAAGTIYLNSMDWDGAQWVSSSTDGGHSFSAPRLVSRQSDLQDKNWMAVDSFPASPTANRLFVGWTRFAIGAGDEFNINHGIQSVYSGDAGKSWSIPGYLSPVNCLGLQPAFLPGGTLAVLYWNYVDSFTSSLLDVTHFTHHRIEIAMSADGGATFQGPRVVAPFRLHHDPVARDGFGIPSLATDRQAGVLYVTWQAGTGPDNAVTPAILFTKSIDRGQTWSTPVAVNDTPDRRSVFNPAIAVSPDGQHVTIIFCDKRHDTTAGYLVDLYLAESFDGGDTWEPNLRLSEFSSDLRKAPRTGYGYMFGDYQAIVPALDFVTPAVACWIDARSGNPDPFAVRIQRTRGPTFETWRKLRFSTADLANAEVSGPAADGDADGIPNSSEYALGLEPGKSDASPLSISLVGDAVSGRLLEVKFTTPAVVTDAAFSWESSVDLANWQLVSPASEIIEGSGLSRTHTLKFALIPEATQFFLRFGNPITEG